MGLATRVLTVGLAAVSLSCSGAVDFRAATAEQKLDLAACLSEGGYVLYTADYCGHCRRQTEMFGKAAARLTSVSCKKKMFDDKEAACVEAGVTAYPTWVAPDGSGRSGVRGLAELAAWSGCGP